MVKEQAALTERHRRSISLDQRLWLHKRLSAESFSFARCALLLIFVVVSFTLPLTLLTTKHSMWMVLTFLAFLYGYFFLLMLLLVLTNLWWERNVIAMAKENSLVAVGPLLDMAALTFLGKYKPASKPETSSEQKVFQYLPNLLSRMPAGDGPRLSARQRETLRRLFVSPRYRSRFDLTGLEAKIKAMVAN